MAKELLLYQLLSLIRKKDDQAIANEFGADALRKTFRTWGHQVIML